MENMPENVRNVVSNSNSGFRPPGFGAQLYKSYTLGATLRNNNSMCVAHLMRQHLREAQGLRGTGGLLSLETGHQAQARLVTQVPEGGRCCIPLQGCSRCVSQQAPVPLRRPQCHNLRGLTGQSWRGVVALKQKLKCGRRVTSLRPCQSWVHVQCMDHLIHRCPRKGQNRDLKQIKPLSTSASHLKRSIKPCTEP